MSMGGEVVVKELTQALARSRFALRRMRSRLPLVSRGVEPVRVVLYLGKTPDLQEVDDKFYSNVVSFWLMLS